MEGQYTCDFGEGVYKNMERYINAQDNADELMTTFALVKEESKKEKSPYAHVRSWFFTQFEDCHDLRVLIADENGETQMQKVPRYLDRVA